MKSPLTLSVVIPAFNEEAVIKKSLDSLMKQAELADEIIVVDNNCTDKTVEIARQYKSVRIVHESKQGIGDSRSAGYEAAKSDIVGRIDADSILEPDWVATVKQYMSEHPETIAVTGPCYLYDIPHPKLSSAVMSFSANQLNSMVAGTPNLWGSNMAFRKQLWPKVRHLLNNDSRVWEDLDFTMRIKQYGPITYLKSMKANTSARSAKTGPRGLARYFNRWPRTLRQFSWWATVKAYIALFILGVIFIVPLQVSLHWPTKD